jgi:hypothetical protein
MKHKVIKLSSFSPERSSEGAGIKKIKERLDYNPVLSSVMNPALIQ